MMSINSSPISLARKPMNFFSRTDEYKPYMQTDTNDFFTFTTLSSPLHFSEMQIEKKEDDCFDPNRIIQYDDPKIFFHGYKEENDHRNNDNLSSLFYNVGAKDNAMEEERSDHLMPKIEEMSDSTRPSPHFAYLEPESDMHSIKLEGENQRNQDQSSLEAKAKAMQLIQNRTKDEVEYIRSVLSTLLGSCREVAINGPELENPILKGLICNLLESKKAMAETENETIKEMVEEEMSELISGRPEQAIEEEDLGFNKRKVKKIFKGNRNSSSLNHVNENYVSNIFQFAKKNFPKDKEVQKLANERNVSAANFKRLMAVKLVDSAIVKRAKYRIMEGGRELLRNIEYWMKEGYFDQCNDREKYIAHKQKALYDLGLEGRTEIESQAS